MPILTDKNYLSSSSESATADNTVFVGGYASPNFASQNFTKTENVSSTLQNFSYRS
jgi:hypothetical protein